MGRTNPILVEFEGGGVKKRALAILDMPPAVSVQKLLYGQAPALDFPVSIHNFSDRGSVDVAVTIDRTGARPGRAYEKTVSLLIPPGGYKETLLKIPLPEGSYTAAVAALGAEARSQIGVEAAAGSAVCAPVDLNGDGIMEYRLENEERPGHPPGDRRPGHRVYRQGQRRQRLLQALAGKRDRHGQPPVPRARLLSLRRIRGLPGPGQHRNAQDLRRRGREGRRPLCPGPDDGRLLRQPAGEDLHPLRGLAPAGSPLRPGVPQSRAAHDRAPADPGIRQTPLDRGPLCRPRPGRPRRVSDAARRNISAGSSTSRRAGTRATTPRKTSPSSAPTRSANPSSSTCG